MKGALAHRLAGKGRLRNWGLQSGEGRVEEELTPSAG
jgi:hypothetical protein